MAQNLTTEDFEFDEDGQMVPKSRTKYVAPKLMATLTTQDKKDKKALREKERANRTLLHNTFVKSLGDEYTDRNTFNSKDNQYTVILNPYPLDSG